MLNTGDTLEHSFSTPRLVAYTYVDVDAVQVEGADLGRLIGEETVELLAVLVPLDGVERLPARVVLAGEHGGAVQLGVGRHAQPPDLKSSAACNTITKVYSPLQRLLMSSKWAVLQHGAVDICYDTTEGVNHEYTPKSV